MSSSRIYIGRLNYDVRERDLEKFFKGYGRIQEIHLKKGFGFVEFADYRDADDAVYELNGKELLGDRVTIEHARGIPQGSDRYSNSGGGGGGGRSRGYRNNAPPDRNRRQGGARDNYGPPTRTEYRLLVENLSSRVSWQNLKDYMRQAGEVTYADAHKQRRNEGVVEFASFSDMKNAIEKLDDTELNGRRIRLTEKNSRSRRRSRSRSKSRSRSRSRSKTRRGRRSKSHSESNSRSRSRSRSKSHSRSKSVTPRRNKSRSHSRSRSTEKSHKESKSRSRSKSLSKTPENREKNSPHNDKTEDDEGSMDEKD